MPKDDLETLAKSASTDYYAILSLDPSCTEQDIKRAARKHALKYHPDKNPDDETARDVFEQGQLAQTILMDPALRAIFDNARAAREAKMRQSAMFDARRREMAEKLSAREDGALKRKREADEAAQKLERLAEDGRKRRKEMEERLQRERERELNGTGDGLGEMHQQPQVGTPESMENGASMQGQHPSSSPQEKESSTPEIERTVKVRFSREPSSPHADLTKSSLSSLFAHYGIIETALLLKDKRLRDPVTRKKRLTGTGVLIFSTLAAASAALESKIDGIEVFWADKAGEDPTTGDTPASTPAKDNSKRASLFAGLNSSSFATPRTPSNASTFPATPVSNFKASIGAVGSPGGNTDGNANGNGLRKVPSFASFSASVSGSAPSPTPSLEESTLARLKAAEKRRLEDEIRRREKEEEDSAV